MWDGTYDLADLLDIHEMMTVNVENQWREHEAHEREMALRR